VQPSPERPSQEHFVRLWNYAKFSWIGSVQSKTFHKADILILGLFVSAGLTGVYAVAYTLATFLGILGSAMNNVFFPEMSRLSAQNKIKEIGSLTNDAVTFSGVFFIPGVVGATVLGDRLLRIYGTSFEKGHWILVILLIALSIYAYTKQLLNALNAVDRPDLAFRANGLFVATNVALNFGLVWAVGWYGAAVATAVSATVGLVAAYYYFYQLVPLSIPIAEIIRQVTAAGIMGIAVAGALALGENSFGWINSHNIVFVILLVTFGAVVYFIVLFFISVRMRKAIKDNILAIFMTVE
jgi:O-antigen/teichoic acid export membrane protein